MGHFVLSQVRLDIVMNFVYRVDFQQETNKCGRCEGQNGKREKGEETEGEYRDERE